MPTVVSAALASASVRRPGTGLSGGADCPELRPAAARERVGNRRAPVRPDMCLLGSDTRGRPYLNMHRLAGGGGTIRHGVMLYFALNHPD